MRRSIGVVVSMAGITVWLILLAVPASAGALARASAQSEPELTRVEARQYARWWDTQTLGESLALLDMPMEELRVAAERAWALGVSRGDLQAALFSNAALTLFADNAAGGLGQPSPYVEYFTNNPSQLGGLGSLFTESPDYVVGPGGTQEQLFAAFVGLRDSYLASLGLRDVNGRIVDPRNPLLSPYLVELFMGPPEPLPQPGIALNVAAT